MNTLYENFVLESKLEELLTTKINVQGLVTVDESLTQSAGMIKKINTYTYNGGVEKLTKGAKNTIRGSLTFTTAPYEVEVTQGVFDYFDEDYMQDNLVVDYGMTGGAATMVNDMTSKYFTELNKATLNQEYTGTITYDTVVDAIAQMNLEDENGLFLIINPSEKADLRKDPDFMNAKQGEIIFNGMIGTISGIPVIVSKAVADGMAYVATKEAVKLFVKKGSEVEQERDAEARKNTIIMRKVSLLALVDATKVVKIIKKA